MNILSIHTTNAQTESLCLMIQIGNQVLPTQMEMDKDSTKLSIALKKLQLTLVKGILA